MNNALVVNDDESICDRLSEILENLGWEVYTADDELGTRRVCETFSPSLIIVDVEMRGGVGFEAMAQARRVGGAPYIIAITRGAYDHKIQSVAEVCGADTIIVGPISAKSLRQAMLNCGAGELLYRMN